jgi:flagellar biosynthesis protein FlhA
MINVLKRVQRYSDLAAAAVVVLVVVMMVVPLPAALLDLMITANISAALAIVVATLYMPRALDFSSFPSLLLLTTLFRLAINVSVTRLILLEGDAGHVVSAFGEFVVGGNVVVGLVIFLILIVIQFVVLTSGAGRVAEVGARFTLDAMPGKQMAIDADLNAGQITEEEARRRRKEISEEADFYGAMDGASKFVKGDAVAAVMITVVNLVGGIIVGVVQQGMPIGQAVNHFSEEDLGTNISNQIFSQPKAPLVAGGVIMCFALVPALPKLPFLIIGGILLAIGIALSRHAKDKVADDLAESLKPKPQIETADSPHNALQIDPLELVIGFGLVPLVDASSGGGLLQRVSAVRRQLAQQLGTVVPKVRIHDDVTLGSHEYAIRVRGSEVARGRIIAGHQLALDPGDAFGQLEGIQDIEPAFGLPATWVADGQRAEAEALGYTVVDPESVLVTHLTESVRTHISELLSRQDTKMLLDGLRETNAAVVEEVVPDLLSVGEIQRVLQALLSEGISIRDLGTILEAIGDKARLTRDPSLLAEYARQALGRTIVAAHLESDKTLKAIALDPAIEQELSEAITTTTEGEYLAMSPPRAQALIEALSREADDAIAQGRRPVLLCSSRVRRHVRRLCSQTLPQLSVCAYNEVTPGVNVETIGVVTA